MLYATDFQRNTEKPQENFAFSWSGAVREHASETFFGDFSASIFPTPSLHRFFIDVLWLLFGFLRSPLVRMDY